jgi:hypothetical protein
MNENLGRFPSNNDTEHNLNLNFSLRLNQPVSVGANPTSSTPKENLGIGFHPITAL